MYILKIIFVILLDQSITDITLYRNKNKLNVDFTRINKTRNSQNYYVGQCFVLNKLSADLIALLPKLFTAKIRPLVLEKAFHNVN